MRRRQFRSAGLPFGEHRAFRGLAVPDPLRLGGNPRQPGPERGFRAGAEHGAVHLQFRRRAQGRGGEGQQGGGEQRLERKATDHGILLEGSG